MHDLAPLCALGASTPRSDTVAGVTLTETPGFALASVAARRGQERACATQLGVLLTGTAPDVGTAVQGDPLSAFWTGPDQWMVSAPFRAHDDLAGELKSHFGPTASITDQTDAWCRFDMHGDGAETVMQLCANIDFEQMRSTNAARTVIHYMGVYVIRDTSDSGLILLGARSSAVSLHHALMTAMRAAL